MQRDALLRHPLAVAPDLLGVVVTGAAGPTVAVRITEVEAYGGVDEDPGSHAYRRRTPRNDAMFGPVGHAYVYFTYGMHWCLNVVAHEPGAAGAVLLRAGQIVTGLDTARARRGSSVSTRDLARGPARLARALGISGAHDGVDLLAGSGPLRLEPGGPAPGRVIRCGPRTGVGGAGEALPWRFWVADDPTVSPHRPASGPRVRPPSG